MNATTIGFALLVVAAIANANFATPMKYTRRWAWENTWLAWTIFALMILPPLIAWATVPSLTAVYGEAGMGLVTTVAAYGAGWGIAQVFFGLAVEVIGVALTFSIVMGISAAMGSLVPMLRLHPDKINTAPGHVLLGGVALMLVGVAVCAYAGRRRERALHLQAGEAGRSHTTGLVLAILCGLGASFVNFGLAFGAPIARIAETHGATPLGAVNAVWLPVMLAGAIPNLLYCAYLLRRKRSGSNFSHVPANWLLAFLMAVLWFGSTLLYGSATLKLGTYGPILGWPLFMSLIVVCASAVGVATGEWKQSGRKPLLFQCIGVAFLILAVFLLTNTSRNFT